MRLKAGICSSFTQRLCDQLKSINVLTVSDYISSDLEEIAVKFQVSFKVLTVVTLGFRL